MQIFCHRQVTTVNVPIIIFFFENWAWFTFMACLILKILNRNLSIWHCWSQLKNVDSSRIWTCIFRILLCHSTCWAIKSTGIGHKFLSNLSMWDILATTSCLSMRGCVVFQFYMYFRIIFRDTWTENSSWKVFCSYIFEDDSEIWKFCHRNFSLIWLCKNGSESSLADTHHFCFVHAVV